MLTARERAELMSARIVNGGSRDDQSYTVLFRAWPRRDGSPPEIELSGRGYAQLAHYLEQCLDAHERERDYRAVPRGLLAPCASTTKDRGPAADLTLKYGYPWHVGNGYGELWVGGESSRSVSWSVLPAALHVRRSAAPEKRAFDDLISRLEWDDDDNWVGYAEIVQGDKPGSLCLSLEGTWRVKHLAQVLTAVVDRIASCDPSPLQNTEPRP